MRYAALWLLCCSPVMAQTPRLLNARSETRPVSNLDSDFQAIVKGQSSPAWIGYAVPAIPHRGDSWCGGFALEGRNFSSQTTGANSGPVQLEGSRTLVVLYRIENHAVDKVRTSSLDCELDAGGLPFYWLTGVRPADSVRLLGSDAVQHGESTNAAIAQHNDPAADQALENFVAPAQPEKMREKALFWLGSTRGRHGYEVLKRVVAQDTSDRVREKAMFALSVSKEPEALTTLLDTAKNDRSPRVRGQALFWLANKAGKKETAAITDAIRNDPDTQVKRRAVFALQQLPKDEGVPLLIEVAKTNKNPEVRKQAMFWLGQSKDPRATLFFEQILK